MKHLQLYTTTFELDYRKFELLTQIHQLSTILQYKIEEVFEALETADIDMLTVHYMIVTIFNQSFDNKIHNLNGPNQRQNIHEKLVNSINSDSIKDQEPHQLYA